MSESKDIDLLLIGKTGHGKSATGNSILGRTAFKSRHSTSSVTKQVDYEVSEFNGRVIKVVDVPGVGDNRLDNERAINLVLETLQYAIVANPRGYHAFLLVVRNGVRFTVEEQETIAFLKKVFGENLIRTYCILVMTCGDHFDKDSDPSFEEWCKDQKGHFKKLLNECNNRVVLFDNKTKDETERNNQISRLLEMVDNLSSHGNRYTDENFRAAKETRERIILEAKEPIIREETFKETSLILQKLQEMKLKRDFSIKLKALEELKTRAETLLQIIFKRDHRTGVLHDLCETVKSIQATIDDEIKLCYKMKDEKDEIQRKEEEQQKLLEEQLRKERQEYEERIKEQQLTEEKRLEEEQEKKREIEEEMIRNRRETMERDFCLKVEDVNTKWQKTVAELEENYRKTKTENNRSFFKSLASGVTWSFRRTEELSSEEKKQPTTRSTFFVDSLSDQTT